MEKAIELKPGELNKVRDLIQIVKSRIDGLSPNAQAVFYLEFKRHLNKELTNIRDILKKHNS